MEQNDKEEILGAINGFANQVQDQFIKVDQRFDKIEKILELHTEKLVNHDEQLAEIKEKMATKDDLAKLTEGQDMMAATLLKLDQERVFTVGRVDRLEKKIEVNELDVKQIKTQLNIA